MLVDSESSDSGMTIVIIFAVCVCCIFLSITSSIVAYFLLKKKEAAFDRTLLEYRDANGSHIITTLPIDIKDAYYLNMPVGKSRYTFTGQSCLDEVCNDVNLKNVEAINLYYDDAGLFTKGTLLSGKLEYKT